MKEKITIQNMTNKKTLTITLISILILSAMLGPMVRAADGIILDSDHYKIGDPVTVTIECAAANVRHLVKDTIEATAESDITGGDLITITLVETDVDTAIFEGGFTVVAEAPGATDLLVEDGSTVTVTYLALTEAKATIDAKKPTITIDQPADGAVISIATPLIRATLDDGTGSGIFSATMKLDGVTVATEGAVAEIKYQVPSFPAAMKLSEGIHSVEVIASDKVGNEATETWSFTVDLTKPTVSVAVDKDPAKEEEVTFTLTFNEDMDDATAPTVKYGNISPYTSQTVTGSWTTLRKWVGTATVPATTLEGLNRISVAGAKDEAGNTMLTDTSKTFTIDTVAPTSPTGLTAMATDVSVTLSWTASTDVDGTGVKQYEISRGATLIATVQTTTFTDYGPLSEATYSYEVKAVDYAGNGASASVSVDFVPGAVNAYPVSLVEGWNLISLPLIPQDSSIEVVLADVLENVNVVYGYKEGAWVTYLTSAPEFATLTDIEDGKGYWVEMTADDTLIVYGTEQPVPPDAPRVYNVYEGWNLIGLKSTEITEVGSYLTTIPDALTSHMVIYNWDAVNQGYELLCAGAPTAETFSPSCGYWLYLIGDAVIVP